MAKSKTSSKKKQPTKPKFVECLNCGYKQTTRKTKGNWTWCTVCNKVILV